MTSGEWKPLRKGIRTPALHPRIRRTIGGWRGRVWTRRRWKGDAPLQLDSRRRQHTSYWDARGRGGNAGAPHQLMRRSREGPYSIVRLTFGNVDGGGGLAGVRCGMMAQVGGIGISGLSAHGVGGGGVVVVVAVGNGMLCDLGLRCIGGFRISWEGEDLFQPGLPCTRLRDVA